MRGSRTQNKNCKYKEVSKVTVSQNYPCWLLCETCCTVFSNFSASVCFLTAVTTFSPPKNKRQKKYRSIISDVFDGTIVSSVQCLTCDRVSAFGCLFVVRSDWNVNENAEMLSRNRGVGRKNAILMMGGKMICDHSDIFALRIILQRDSSWQILIKKKKKNTNKWKSKKEQQPHYTSTFCGHQVSVTLENFQDISLPIPGKEDLAKLHSSTHQTSLVKAGSCGEAYAPQGWIAFVMEYIKRCVYNPYAVFFIYLFFTSGTTQ